MSVFYNVRMDGLAGMSNRDNGKNVAEFRETRTDNILAEQDQYQVGVDRFSIPSAGLPFCLIDTKLQDHGIGFYFDMKRGGSGTLASERSGGIGKMCNINGTGFMLNQALEDIELAGAYAGLAPLQKYNKKTDPDAYDQIDIDDVCKEIPLQNEREVQEVLNAGTQHAFVSQMAEFNYDNFQGSLGTFPETIGRLGKFAIVEKVNQSLFHHPASNVVELELELGDTGLVSGTSNPSLEREIRKPNPTPTALFSKESMMSFFVILENIKGETDADGNVGHLENLRLEMTFKKRKGGFITIPLMDNLNTIQSWSNVAGSNHFKNRLILSPIAPISVEKLINKSLLDGGNTGVIKNYLGRPTLDDDFYINALNNNIDGLALTNVRLFNDGDNGDFTIGRFRLCMCNIPTTNAETNNTLDVLKQNPFTTTGSLMPTFNYDASEKKFSYTTSSNFFKPQGAINYAGTTLMNVPAHSSNNIFFTYDLASLFRFTYLDTPSNYTTGNVRLTAGKAVENAVFTNLGGRRIAGNSRMLFLDTSHLDLKEPTPISNQEVQESKYERKLVRQILITTTTMSVNGEFEEGRSMVRILTDFEPDIDEPYTIFQFQAKPLTRYYPLRSTLPLRDVGLKIMYNDKFGTTRPYLLNKGDTATIKLEFRPNNMIYYYE